MFAFDNTYAHLPQRFYASVTPKKVRDPQIVKVNGPLAELLGVDSGRLDSADGAQLLSGNVVPRGAEPIALAYAGHQFGVLVPQLGDGRAILLGEVLGTDGVRRDVQLKGSGRTPFSRGGDGLAALGPVLREYIVSEAMAALGIPTTRTLAAVTTGEPVLRDGVLPGAVLTRVAASHIRVGTFQFFGVRRDREALVALSEYALRRHYPERAAPGANLALELLDAVASAQARLVARWLGVGFVHGVMNTDNTAISGETIDYGPCAFLDAYDPEKKFSSIDHFGRYAFENQPRIAQWNLARLAEALLPLIADDEEEAIRMATSRIEGFTFEFEAAYDDVLRAKLGLSTNEDGDRALARDLLGRLDDDQVDFTLFFRRLCQAAIDPVADDVIAASFKDPGAFHEWAERWRDRSAREDTKPEARAAAMRRANPAFIPRNHRVEEALDAAVQRGDFEPFETLMRVLARPYEDQPEHSELADPPSADFARDYQTFCGT